MPHDGFSSFSHSLKDSNAWLVNGPKLDLPFILADNGYDVWFSNTRGTKFSRQHVSLDPSNSGDLDATLKLLLSDHVEFWNWTWDELVAYDLPAVFDYVSNKTGQKINYIGHSQGTLIALASFSEGKLINQVKSAVLLSPIAYLSHMTTKLGLVVANTFIAEVHKTSLCYSQILHFIYSQGYIMHLLIKRKYFFFFQTDHSLNWSRRI
ncbi:putative triacylglycerol lipase [Lupinus albus]|uniref:Putative triacylglycerol lipase n=1 Tax=Lupinus albus TaxID=3870 RepID=A0A6A4PEB3_LUPAL|nr:putative triacylglycerol lipase [Lupinus albus]